MKPSWMLPIVTILFITACDGVDTSELTPQIRSGVAHTCLLNVKGEVFCWGQVFSQDLVASPENFAIPIRVRDMSAVAIGAGWYHTCAAAPNGRVFCWGQNVYGQLWDNPAEDASTPVEIGGLENVTSLAAGSAHTCALTAEGKVYCWGQNDAGQVGDGTTTERLEPVPVEGLSGKATRVTAASKFTCALLSDGQVECWGLLTFVPAQGDTERVHPSPFLIPNLDRDVLEIAAGTIHLCVLTKSGKVMCEGMIDPPNDPPFAAPSKYIQGVQGRTVHLLAGTDFTCVLTVDQTVECWGDNYFGQLGNQTGIGSAIPVIIDLKGQNAELIGGGYYTACALLVEGNVTCWGDTSFGQTGNGTAGWK